MKIGQKPLMSVHRNYMDMYKVKWGGCRGTSQNIITKLIVRLTKSYSNFIESCPYYKKV